MKIVQVCPSFFPYYGGEETHVREISKRLVRLGLEVRVLTPDPTRRLPKEELVDGIAISRFFSFTFDEIHFFAPRLYATLMRLKDVDLIHIHDYQDLPDLALLLSMNSKVPFVLTPHFHPVGGSAWRTLAKGAYGLFLGKRLLKKAHRVIAVSKHEKELLRKEFGLHDQNIKYVPNGVDVKKFESVKRKNVRDKVVLFVGRLEKYKGAHFLLEAFPRIKDNVPSSRLLIVGTGPYKNSLLRMADHLKLRDDVEFRERVSEKELMRLYCSSSVFVIPSRYEAFCIALVEAMACGLPVIATKVGGMKELIKPNLNGLLVDYPPDEDLLVDLITKVLTNEDFSKRLGSKAREFVLANFSWDNIVRDILKVYKEVLHEN